MNAASVKPKGLALYAPALFVWLMVVIAGFIKTGPDLLRGALPGNDDYMRLVQIRDWLGGAGFRDPQQLRMFPPDPLQSHWGRLTDMLVGGVIKVLTPIMGGPAAEMTALILIPAALLLIAILLVVKLASRLSDSAWMPLGAALSAGLCFPVFYQFYPGRIDHHGLQIVLALGTALALISSDKRPWLAALAGTLCAISLWVGIESAPYVIAACISVSLFWVLGQSHGARRLTGFAISFTAVTLTCLFIASDPTHWRAACDALSPVFAVMAGAIGGAMLLASIIGRKVTTPFWRLVIIGVLGLGAAALTIGLYPQCLKGPYAELDPRLAEVWLANVTEAKPFHRFFANNHLTGLLLITVPVIAILGVLFGYPKTPLKSKLIDNATIRTLLVFMIVTAITGLIQTRMFSFSGSLGAPLAGALIARMADRMDDIKSDFTRALARVGVLALLSPMLIPAALGLAFPSESEKNKSAYDKNLNAMTSSSGSVRVKCTAPAAIESLNALPAGFAITQIDLGAPVLAGTHHSVTSAPYHRNEKGLLTALDVFMGTPDEARIAAAAINADYVFACKADEETQLLTRLASHGLLAQLVDGKTPPWLEPVKSGADNPILAYHITRK